MQYSMRVSLRIQVVYESNPILTFAYPTLNPGHGRCHRLQLPQILRLRPKIPALFPLSHQALQMVFSYPEALTMAVVSKRMTKVAITPNCTLD